MTEPEKPGDIRPSEKPADDVTAKFEAIRRAAAYCDAPTGEIEDMLAEIELGYISPVKIENE
jgi:hypothetical protein